MRWFELRFPPQPTMIGVARSTVVETAHLSGLDDAAVEDARTCISEAVTNALNAHTANQSADPVLVRLGSDVGTLVLEVHDSGGGPPKASAHPQMPSLDDLDALPEGGFGIPVMHALADECVITSAEGGGTIVRLRFGPEPT